jgi:2-polyprenyl-3-methyl-5-hydroxy-6-metoxy-1,4-benzoquinol methylase
MPAELTMFSQAWYDEYFRRADTSSTHRKFCLQVYGRDLCQHGMMDMQELNFLISMLQPHSKILDIGCGNGRISEYIQRYTNGHLLGVDSSKVAITQAKARNEGKNGLEFLCLNVSQQELPAGPYDAVLLVDSVYILGEPAKILPRLAAVVRPHGRMIISAMQTCEIGDPKHILQADHTFLATALDTLGYRWVAYDFSANLRKHWLSNFQTAEEMKAAFVAEGNQFLYDARCEENVPFKEHVEHETITRYLYVIEINNE